MVVKLKIFVAIALLLQGLNFACGKKAVESPTSTDKLPSTIATDPKQTEVSMLKTGAERVGEYLPFLGGKRVSLMVNQTSKVGGSHLVDTLLALGIGIEKIFAPEHGFRGEADAGEKLTDGKDAKTGLPVISLYGDKKKPTPADLSRTDLVVFDVQDVGARFYTYISAMTYLMEACAENKIPLLILDRPNPNGHYVDGPVMQPGFESYVGLHVGVPVVHGMTVGEYAQMVNGEGWLSGGKTCDLTVQPCENYDHTVFYELPVPPSPNLPNMRSIYLYPSLCFFEGTNVSVGRGTDKQFQVIGMPGYKAGDFSFTPMPGPGAKHPFQEGKLCQGHDFSGMEIKSLQTANQLEIKWLLEFYKNCPDQNSFFLKNNFFDKLSGGETLRHQILVKKSEQEIRASWQPGITTFKGIRAKYLIYAQ